MLTFANFGGTRLGRLAARSRLGWHDEAVASDDESARTVVVALLANLGIVVAKLAAAMITGSTAMFAETVHSAADTGNSVLLLVAQHRSGRPAAPSGLSRGARRTSGRC
jgi:Co/Zn/Cd efflux system component